MKKILSLLSLAALFLTLIVACDPKKTDGDKPALVTTVSGLTADGVKLSWAPVPNANRTKIEWKSASGKVSGSLTVEGNEALVQPKATGELLTFNIISLNGDEVLSTSTFALAMSNPYPKSYEADTILSGDVIIQRVAPAKDAPSTWCELSFDPCTLSDYCDGKVLAIARSAGVEEIYKVTVEGSRVGGTAYTVSFLLRVDTAGAITYATKDQLACLSLEGKHLCTAGRVTAYDNGDFAFVMHGTSVGRGRGVMFKYVDNIRSVQVGKAGGCE
jgi:hypothetical protein